jgi:dUTPase
MPRRQRQDYQPEILLPDVREQERRANDAIGNEYRAKVRPVDCRLVVDGWTNTFNRTEEAFQSIRRSGDYIDEGLVSFMMRHCAMAASSPIRDEHNQLVLRDGFIVHRLRRVGCRIYMTQEEIGRQYGRSRQHVNEQISQMKKYGLIVNKGEGWYEFDARLCWRGDFKIQKAYREIQIVRDGLIITDGKSTLVTEDMDADECGDHSPRQVEEEE